MAVRLAQTCPLWRLSTPGEYRLCAAKSYLDFSDDASFTWVETPTLTVIPRPLDLTFTPTTQFENTPAVQAVLGSWVADGDMAIFVNQSDCVGAAAVAQAAFAATYANETTGVRTMAGGMVGGGAVSINLPEADYCMCAAKASTDMSLDENYVSVCSPILHVIPRPLDLTFTPTLTYHPHVVKAPSSKRGSALQSSLLTPWYYRWLRAILHTRGKLQWGRLAPLQGSYHGCCEAVAQSRPFRCF